MTLKQEIEATKKLSNELSRLKKKWDNEVIGKATRLDGNYSRKWISNHIHFAIKDCDDLMYQLNNCVQEAKKRRKK